MKTISYGISYERMYTYSISGMAICRINTWDFFNVMFQETHVSRVTMVNGWASIFAMISLQDFRCSQGNLHTHSLKPTSIQNQPTLRHPNLRSYQGIPFKTYPYHQHRSPQEVFAWYFLCLKTPEQVTNSKWDYILPMKNPVTWRWNLNTTDNPKKTEEISFLTNSICLNDNMTTKPQPAQWNIKIPCLTNYTVFKGNTGHFTSLWFTQIHKLTKAVKQTINTQPCLSYYIRHPQEISQVSLA